MYNGTFDSAQQILCEHNGSKICESNMQEVICFTINNLNYFHKHLIIIVIVSVLVIATAAFGNGLIIISIFRSPNLHTPSYILITSLAFTDLLVGVVLAPMHIAYCSILLQKGTTDLCLFIMLFEIGTEMLGIISVNTSLLISIDRYLALTRRQRYREIVTKKKTTLSVVIVWLISIILVAIVFQANLTMKQRFVFIGTFGTVLFITICVFYLLSFKTLRQYTSQIQSHENGQQAGTFNVQKYRKTLKTMLIILFSITFSVVFVLATSFLWIMTKNNAFRSNIIFNNFAIMCFAFSSSTNPLIYLIRFKDIRHSCRQNLGI